MRRPSRLRLPPARGSTLIFAVILVAVLTAIGGAAVLLSSRDRINASAKTSKDEVSACAAAAQVKVWAELAKYGTNLFGSGGSVTEMTLADGTRLGALHYDQAATSPWSSVVVVLSMDLGDVEIGDLTNVATGRAALTKGFRVVARCTVPGQGLFGRDRQVELEFRIRTRM